MPLPRLRFVTSLVILGLAVAPIARAQRTCGTASPTPEQAGRMLEQLQMSLQRSALACGGGNIAVAFHVLHNGATAYVTPAEVAAQIAVLNADYLPWGYHFQLASLDYTSNAAWYTVPNGLVESQIKNALAIDPAHTINIYTGDLSGGLLGFAYLPGSYPEASKANAVFLHYLSLPGFNFVPYDLGRTGTHEVGHYLGLLHTFEGGCVPPDDYVADTPEEAGPNFGCPIGTDSCPADPGLDPIHNYMDYTDDACYSEFTAGQANLMCAMLATYRPSLVAGGPTPVRQGTWGELKVRYR